MNIKTISDVEESIESSLLDLSQGKIAPELVRLLVPAGFRPVVELREEGRKKRRTAAAKNWTPTTGEIVIHFEPVRSSASEAGSRAQVREPEDPMEDLLNALERAESQPGRSFVALKYFRDEFLPRLGLPWAESPELRQQLLAQAIQAGRILTSKVPNPKSPLYPTTAIKLNPRERAGSAPERASRFRAVAVTGEPLSATLLRDRGRR